ncbi:MAG: carboxypeptidase-like regulatory domain-containing protein [Flavobacteriales bacterium]|nr:carboxypeptidase-like regulatory domain-containing protein [Flavobacteriales bacterium]
MCQTTVVEGHVRDALTNEGLPFVNLAFKGSKIGTSTDINGYYRIESYYATDSLVCSYVGYKRMTKRVRRDREQKVDFLLETSSVELQEVVVRASEWENPAHEIIRNVQKYRKVNNREKLEAYEYEVYNKVEFDLNNMTEAFTQKKLFRSFDFIFDNIDSTDSKAYLPLFMTESLSDFYYKQKPTTEKEVIKATKVSGIKNESISQFLGDMYQNVNIYNNYIFVFGKNFISPIANSGFSHYKYYLKDSAFIEDKWCYLIEYLPKKKQELTFSGEMWINDTTYAVKRVVGAISESANINFITDMVVRQEYDEVEDEVWMLTKDDLVIDFNLGEKTMGLYGRKSTSYKDFVINKPRDDDFYFGAENIILSEGFNDKDEEFWESARHDTLTKNQENIYAMVDSLKKIPQFNTYVDILTLVVTGYKEVGNFELGPYFTVYSYNPVEGSRIRLGGRTSNQFSTRTMLEGYAAYGFKDKEWKYMGGFLYFLEKKPRVWIEGKYSRDIEQLGQSSNAFQQDNLLSSALRRNPNNKLTMLEEVDLSLQNEWFDGFSSGVELETRRYEPRGSLVYERFDNEVQQVVTIPELATTELKLKTRFAYKEKYVYGEFERVSLGTRFPILTAEIGLGMQGLFGGEFGYQRIRLGLQHKVRMGFYGNLDYRFEAGRFFGDPLPYPLLFLHQGNETFFYDESSYNTMNFFEFISDEYVAGAATWHLEGFFLNRIPLLRKLKWREVFSIKGVIGRYDEINNTALQLLDNSFTLEQKPFGEAGIGIENIFKVLRIDALWRLSYLDNPDIVKFGIRAKLQLDF